MIAKESRSIEWITQVAKENNAKDIGLVEKTIRAFSLLESLARSGCPFIFKGGSCLMLHFNTSRRLSIDIDIVCPPGTDIEAYIGYLAEEYGFGEVKLVDRLSRDNVPKSHAKYYYEVAYGSQSRPDKILLDVLFEENHYNDVVLLPIRSPFLKTEGEDILVKVPSIADLLGDKLTAFAPHTTGIPFYKRERDCSMEIIKQMYDIACLYDLTENLNPTDETYDSLVAQELGYRNLLDIGKEDVLQDTLNAAMNISTKGLLNIEEFQLYLNGITRIRGFIHSETYSLESAIRDSSKVAYITASIIKANKELKHYHQDVAPAYQSAMIEQPFNTKLNKLKKTNFEAFYYWYETYRLLQSI